jgi:hypothetical protein
MNQQTKFYIQKKLIPIKHCASDICKGFLDIFNICYLCNKKSCSQCQSILDSDHICDPIRCEIVSLLNRDTKHCKNCNFITFNDEQLSEKKCHNCKTFLNWEFNINSFISIDYKSILYNDKFYLNSLDEIDPINFAELSQSYINNLLINLNHSFLYNTNELSKILLLGSYIQNHVVSIFKKVPELDSNLRIKCLTKKVDENFLNKILKSSELNTKIYKEFSLILKLYLHIQSGVFASLLENNISIKRTINSMECLRLYTNKAFSQKGLLYNTTYPGISENNIFIYHWMPCHK